MRLRGSVVAPIAGVALLLAGWAAGPVGAQESGDRLVVRAVDATEDGRVRAVIGWSGEAGALGDMAVTNDGEPVDVEIGNLADAGIRNDIAIVVDTSQSTDGNGLLTNAKQALTDVVGDLPGGVRAAIVGAGPTSQTAQNLTDDDGRLRAAIDDLTPSGEGGVLAGVVRGAAIVSESRVATMPTVVLLTDGVEEPTATFDQARAALTEAGAALFVVGLQDGVLDEAGFGSLAAESGGRMVTATDAADLGSFVGSIEAELIQLATVTFAVGDAPGVHDLAVAVGDARVDASYIAGSNLVGAQRVEPRPTVEPGGIAFFRSDAGWYLGIALAVVAAALFAYGVFSLFGKEDRLGNALLPYADGYVPSGEEDDDPSQALAQTALLQRAVAITERFATRQGILVRLEKQLEKSDLPLRAGEALFFYAAGVVVVLALGFALTKSPVGGLLAGLGAALIPPGLLGFFAGRKKRQFEGLLPDTLQLLSSTLKAGYSMVQGVDAVSQEAAEPMGKELRRVMTEARLGRPLEESLDAVAERMESPDFGWAVMAIRIQREVGGNLAELLLTVAETMTERERLRRDVNALTAEGRMSAYVLLGLPIGLTFFLYSINPEYMSLLFERTVGQIMLGAAAAAMLIGYVWMKKIITIEI